MVAKIGTFAGRTIPVVGWLILASDVSQITYNVPLELDTHLQDYSAPDELHYAIEDFGKKFGVDVSKIDMSRYCPIIKTPPLNRLIKGSKIREEIVSNRPPFTVRMFAESAKTGRWVYD